MIKIKVKKLINGAKLPKYSIAGDAGLDLCSVESKKIPAKKQVAIRTGLAIEFPKGYCGLIWDKSGLAFKKGITVLGGVFEHTYRGEYMIALYNTGTKSYQVKKGQKIAQLLIQPIASVEVKQVNNLSTTKRGANAFGSTGK